MIEMELTNSVNKFQIDEICFAAVWQYKWYLHRVNGVPTRIVRTTSPSISLGAYILGIEPNSSLIPDHIDRSIFNNQIYNLRVATKQQNSTNTAKQQNKSSKYKGVRWHKRRLKWNAQITYNKYARHLGSFDSEIEAAKAYNKAAIEAHGEFACINRFENEE